ncbi:ComEA family DNA-binding protein [Ferruginibacter albus]|uniref:ComEA family DNA-binding protein n=1 Tax=Ferruginibacter albus TaxID=2875540 RepID=UPI001CC555ED|nr:helix-hairpin-helix domain-containing protein [Ferruginibacter albus]UAY51737.1 helix-hairpin-helix domain-containing protein [Ferruginibacter albus]
MRRAYSLLLVLFLAGSGVKAQVADSIPDVQDNPVLDQQLENATSNSDDNATEDDSYIQLLRQYARNRLNLNTATAEEMEDLQLLSPLQIENIISYRKVFGKFLSIYELQAIPTLDVATIAQILPYVTVNTNADVLATLGQRFKGGNSSLLVRETRVLEKSRGYTDYPKGDSSDHIYPGSPDHLLLRYKYNYKNLLQYGFTAEKDAGEELFKGSQKQGFDFYSAHLFARNIGIIKALALGDFTVNLGQGLTQWQSLAFGKSAANVMNIKRQSPVLRPYSSPGEVLFNRGAGITLGKNNFEATVFGSYRKIDGSINSGADTLTQDDYFSSIDVDGYHRTKTELANKNVIGQTSFGGNLSYNKDNFHIGINAVRYIFSTALAKGTDSFSTAPYNLYRSIGDKFGNYSVDYSYTYRNMHFFGEAATTSTNHYAFVDGLLISVDPTVDMSFLYRNISPSYQSIYGNPFIESSTPENEEGFYSGISIHPNRTWTISAYADFFKFPWLRFLVDAPSTGSDYQAQVSYTPNKQLQIYMRYRSETKPKNYNPDDLILNPVLPANIQNWRIDLSYKVSPVITFRARQESDWYKTSEDAEPETGFLMYADVLYNPKGSRLSGGVRLQYFETDSYNSRIYAFENTVLYGYSIPVFYGKGYRYYVNLNYDVSKRLSLWARWAQLIYKDQNTIGSGYDIIQGNTKSEVTLQGIYRF